MPVFAELQRYDRNMIVQESSSFGLVLRSGLSIVFSKTTQSLYAGFPGATIHSNPTYHARCHVRAWFCVYGLFWAAWGMGRGKVDFTHIFKD